MERLGKQDMNRLREMVQQEIIIGQEKTVKELAKRLQTWTDEGKKTVQLLIKEEFEKAVRQIVTEELDKVNATT